MRAARVAALLMAIGSASAKYNIGDTLSAEDRALEFPGCDGTKYTLGSFLDAGKAIVLDKSAWL
eukprot:7578771-Pyramimonas_sp.AAC.1